MVRISHRINQILLPGAVLLVALIVASCVSVEVESEFHADGSADHVVEATVDRQVLEQLAQQTGQEVDFFQILDQLTQAAEERGFQVERIETDDRVGTRIIAEGVEDNSDLGSVLNEILSANQQAQISMFSGSYTVEDGVYRLEMMIDGQQITELFSQMLGENAGQLPNVGLDTLIDLTYSATMPGTIDEEQTNGQVLDSNHVSWEISLDEEQQLVAVSTDEDEAFPWLLLLIIGGIVLVLLIGGGIILVALTRRGNITPQPAAEAPTPPATADQPTRELPPDVDPIENDRRPDRS